MEDYHRRLFATGLDLSYLPPFALYHEPATLRAAVREGEVELVIWCLGSPSRLTFSEWQSCTGELLASHHPNAPQLWEIWWTVWSEEMRHFLATHDGGRHLGRGVLASLAVQQGRQVGDSLSTWLSQGQVDGVRALCERDPGRISRYRPEYLLLNALRSGSLEMVQTWEELVGERPQFRSVHLETCLYEGVGLGQSLPIADYIWARMADDEEVQLRHLPCSRRVPELDWCQRRGIIADHRYQLPPDWEEQLENGRLSTGTAEILLLRGEWSGFVRWWERLGLHTPNDLPELDRNSLGVYWERWVRQLYEQGEVVQWQTMVQWALVWWPGLMTRVARRGWWEICEYAHRQPGRPVRPDYWSWMVGEDALCWLGERAREEGFRIWCQMTGNETETLPITHPYLLLHHRVDRSIYQLYAEWGVLATEVPAADPWQWVRDPYGYAEHLAALPGDTPPPAPYPVSWSMICVYVDYLRDRGLPLPPILLRDISYYLGCTEDLSPEDDRRLWMGLVSGIREDPLTVIVDTDDHVGQILTAYAKLGRLPDIVDLLSHPRLQQSFRLPQLVRPLVRHLRRRYPGLHLARFGGTICCDLEGPLQGYY